MMNCPTPILVVCTAVLACGVAQRDTRAVEPDWLNAERMQRELQKPIGITWKGRPIRDALKNLAANQRVAIWLDRRIDPSREPEFSIENTPLQQILQDVAQPLGAELGFVGPVVYIGPASTTRKLWTITELRREDLRRLTPAIRSKWSIAKAIQWPELATPRELLQSAADEAGCRLEGLDTIPHDLWDSANLPPMTLTERLTLILAGFDRTFQLDGEGGLIRLTDLPDRPTLQREYAPRGDVSRFLSAVERRTPNATVQRNGPKVAIAGTAEDHDSISRLLRGEPDRRTSTGPAETRYTMNVENQPLGVVLRTLNVKAQLQVQVDEDIQAKLFRLVSFEVKDATLEQLLQAAMREAGLAFELKGLQLRVMAAKE